MHCFDFPLSSTDAESKVPEHLPVEHVNQQRFFPGEAYWVTESISAEVFRRKKVRSGRLPLLVT